jgi:hypothetical protein
VSAPPRDVFAAAARLAIERHDEWDSPHAFETLHWDGVKLTTMTYACIMPDVDPPDYPKLMARLAREELEKRPDDPAYGYLVQAEGFKVVTPAPGTREAEAFDWEQYHRDRLGRTFHKRPDAVETCTAWAADIHGRLWWAEKARGVEGVREAFFGPDGTSSGQMRRMGGPWPEALLAVAYATGMTAWGLPGPQGRMN